MKIERKKSRVDRNLYKNTKKRNVKNLMQLLKENEAKKKSEATKTSKNILNIVTGKKAKKIT